VETRRENPYRPGFNEPPKELAGREAVLADLRDAIEVAALDGRTPRPTMLAGARGVGKTVLLAQAAALAGSQFGWPRAHTEMRPDTPFVPD
jgi:MoxR-like ATPase